MHRIELVIIDPQNDFCYPGAEVAHAKFLTHIIANDYGEARDAALDAFKTAGILNPGSLFVPGANEDMNRLAKMIDEVGDKFFDIHVTMDCHHHIDIAHPVTWINSKGEHPDSFTIITADEVDDDKWFCSFPQERSYCKWYVHQLEDNKRYPLCIWPPHCLIGTIGNALYKPVADALARWEVRNVANVDYLTKGSNWKTEHYSAIQADVPDDEDPTTEMNYDFIKPLKLADELLLSGEALSHCLANTVRDIATGFGDKDLIKKFVLLKGSSSNVPGFEFMGEEFIKDLTADGMRTEDVETYLR
jgi:nicotinamidase-related amidase